MKHLNSDCLHCTYTLQSSKIDKLNDCAYIRYKAHLTIRYDKNAVLKALQTFHAAADTATPARSFD
jgi:hypothetical protein